MVYLWHLLSFHKYLWVKPLQLWDSVSCWFHLYYISRNQWSYSSTNEEKITCFRNKGFHVIPMFFILAFPILDKSFMILICKYKCLFTCLKHSQSNTYFEKKSHIQFWFENRWKNFLNWNSFPFFRFCNSLKWPSRTL